MVQSLTDEQKEQAANTSHAYFVLATTTNNDNINEKSRPSKEDIQESMAMRMARRHLVAQKGNKTKAMEGMIETLKFRNDFRIDDLRRCMMMMTITSKDAIDGHHGDDNNDNDNDTDNKLQRLREEVISGIEASDTVQLRGYDKEDRVLLVRKSSGTKPFDAATTNVDSFLKVQLLGIG